MVTQVKGGRDPFARTTLMRESDTFADKTCDWCGQLGNRRGLLYRYWREDDNGRGSPDNKYFCCIDCWRCYHS